MLKIIFFKKTYFKIFLNKKYFKPPHNNNPNRPELPFYICTINELILTSITSYQSASSPPTNNDALVLEVLA